MELITALSIAAIIIATIVWYQAKVFIAEHVKKYNKFIHHIDFKLLKELRAHEEPGISEKAKKHHRNVKIAAIVIVTAVLVLITQSVN
jgi:hypothetical protein